MPSMHGQSALESYWDKRNEVVPEKVIRKSIRYLLNDTMQDKLDIKDDNCFLVYNESLEYYLDTIKHNKMCRRDTHKRSQDEHKSVFGTNDDSPASSRRISKKSRKEVKETLQVEAIFFSLFNRAGITHSKYSSHSDSSWNDSGYMNNKKFSSSVSDRNTITKSFNK